MKLVNEKETFEFVFENTKEDPKPVFILRKLTYGEVSQIGDSTSILDSQNRIVYLGGTSARLKIKFSLLGWKNVVDEAGREVPCNDDTKEKLPPEVGNWLVRKIDQLNKLSGVGEEERKN